MDGFSQRKKAFETKFSHDEELQFRTKARRNRLIGLWAADVMGLSSDEADTYAQGVIMICFDSPDDEHVINKVFQDLQDAGHEVSEHKVSKELKRLHKVAHDMIYKDIDHEGK